MSYVFNGVNGLLNDDEKDKNAATNIFAPGESGADPTQGAQQQGGEQPKTSTEGEVGGNGPTGGTQTSEAKPAAQTQVADSRLMRKNKVKEAPKFATQAQGDLQNAQKNLQTEADSYVAGAKTKGASYAVDDASLEKAIGGDKDAQGKVGRVMSGTADQYETFAPKTDYQVEDINAMQSDAGLDSLLRREAGAEYSSGEAAFDRSLLKRSAEFNQLRSLLRGQQEGLVKQADEWTGTKSKEAQDAVNSGYEAARSGATTALGSKGELLRKLQEEEAAKENAARKALRESKDPTYAQGESQKAIEKLVADLKASGGDPAGLLKYINPSLADSSKFASVGGDVSWEQAIDDAEANRFNSIMSLLGKTDAWQAGGGFGNQRGFDAKGYADSVYGAADAANKAADAKAQAAIDRIKSEAAKAKANEIAYRNNMKGSKTLGASDASSVEKIRNQLKAEYGGDAKRAQLLSQLNSLVNAGDYVRYNDINADDLDFIDSAQADEYNKALAEIGGVYSNVKAGSRGGPASAFDAAGYEAALRSILNGSGRDPYMSVADKAKAAGDQLYKATDATDTVDPVGRGIKKVATKTKWK